MSLLKRITGLERRKDQKALRWLMSSPLQKIIFSGGNYN